MVSVFSNRRGCRTERHDEVISNFYKQKSAENSALFCLFLVDRHIFACVMPEICFGILYRASELTDIQPNRAGIDPVAQFRFIRSVIGNAGIFIEIYDFRRFFENILSVGIRS